MAPPARLLAPLLALLLIGAACSGDAGAESPTTTTTPRFVLRPEPLDAGAFPAAEPAPVPETTSTTAPLPGGMAGLGDELIPLAGNSGYDVGHYTLRLGVDPINQWIAGSTIIDATATADLGHFNLDFLGMEIESIAVDRENATWVRQGGELVVTPKSSIAAGAPFTTVVRYRGSPRPRSFPGVPQPMGWQWGIDGSVAVGEPALAHTWFPSNDHPSDKATFTFDITVPRGLMVVANGVLAQKDVDEGTTTYRWEMRHDMAPYLALVAVGRFAEVVDPASTLPVIRHFLRPEQAAVPPATLDRTAEMIEFFEMRYGPYPFESYGVLVAEAFAPSVETQTMSVIDINALDAFDLDTHLTHELAHQWWGDSVGIERWADIWLKEGFATYAEWMWLEHEEGPRAYELAVVEAHLDVYGSALPPPGTPPADDLFNDSVYERGALTLHALRVEVGDAAFFEFLREFYDRYAGGVASTADLIAVAQEVSGMDLSHLFQIWLYEPEVPSLP